jgi:hypothetical protein
MRSSVAPVGTVDVFRHHQHDRARRTGRCDAQRLERGGRELFRFGDFHDPLGD